MAEARVAGSQALVVRLGCLAGVVVVDIIIAFVLVG